MSECQDTRCQDTRFFKIKMMSNLLLTQVCRGVNAKSFGNKPFLKFDKLFGLRLFCGVYFEFKEDRVGKSKK